MPESGNNMNVTTNKPIPTLKNSFKQNPINNNSANESSAPAKKMTLVSIKNNQNNTPLLNKSDINLDHISVMEKWPEFLVKIKKYNHSLSFVLQNCQPKEISNGNISLVFKYKFHQDRINDPNIRGIVENTLAEVYGAIISFNSLIDDNLELKKDDDIEESFTSSSITPSPITTEKLEISEESPSSPTSSLMGDLLKNFGGQLIN